MKDKIKAWISRYGFGILLSILWIISLVFAMKPYYEEMVTPSPLKEFKGGIQNHLVWSVDNKCFFVQPHSDVTVYLIPVHDCNR